LDEPDESNWQHMSWADFDDVTLERLDQAAGVTAADATVSHAAEAARKKADQKHEQREELFKTVRRCLVCTLAASALIMAFYIRSQWGNIASAVMISWNVAIVVNTIGLAYIVANYLFSDGQE
jgi:hypothetical protein